MENKEEKKYEILTDEENTIEFEGRILHRIRALKDFGFVKIGEIGGYVQTEDNLSQYNKCWIYDDAKCMDNARVCDNAKMFRDSKMYDNSKMFNNSRMYDNTKMFDNAKTYDNSTMFDKAEMHNNSAMLDNSTMYDNSQMFNNTEMHNNTEMYDNSVMYDNAGMYDCSQMFGNSQMRDYSKMCDESVMYNNAILKNNDKLYGKVNQPFKKLFQYICERRLLTAILTEENEILYSVGCQTGIAKEEFINKIFNYNCGEKGNGLIEYPYRQEYLDMIDIIENYFEKFKN